MSPTALQEVHGLGRKFFPSPLKSQRAKYPARQQLVNKLWWEQCEVYESHRLNELSGPIWQVPIKIPQFRIGWSNPVMLDWFSDNRTHTILKLGPSFACYIQDICKTKLNTNFHRRALILLSVLVIDTLSSTSSYCGCVWWVRLRCCLSCCMLHHALTVSVFNIGPANFVAKCMTNIQHAPI